MGNNISKLVLILALLLSGNADAHLFRGAQSSDGAVLVGIDVSSLESTPPGIPCPATTGIDPECQYYHSKNLNTLRVAFSWEKIQPTLGGALDTTYLGYLQNIIRQTNLLNMKVILDCHNFGYYNGNAIGSVSGPTYAQFANLWLRIATAVVGQSSLSGYDFMNEPQNMPTATTVPEMYQAAVTAVRAIDTVSTIYLEGNGFASSFDWLNNTGTGGGWQNSPLGNGGNNNLLTVVDPNNNLVFSAHSYADSNSSGVYPPIGCSGGIPTNMCEPGASACNSGQTSYQCAQTMGDQLTVPASLLDTNILVKRYKPFVDWCNRNGVRCWIGETGIPYDDTNWYTVLNNGISYLQINKVLFTYWGAGPYFNCAASSEPAVTSACSYYLGAYPANISTTPIDVKQTAVLSSFTNAQQSFTYQLIGPPRGTSGVASSNFTVTYQSIIRQSFTITPNDSGAGGTFTPSSVACSAGYNCLKTFTYTAPGTNVYQISTTNSAGITDPPSLGYATIADQFSSSGAATVNAMAVGRKIFAPYIGNNLTLRRIADGAQQDFGFTGLALNSPLNIAAIEAWNGTSEVDTLFGTQIIVQYATSFWSDGGVVNTNTHVALTRVTSSPSSGQYSVSGSGHYTFNASDIGNTLKITYIFPTYVVNWYDQSLNGNNAGMVVQDGSGPVPNISQQPAFLLNCQNGEPCLYFNGTNYMDIKSPFGTGQTQQSVLAVFSPNFPVNTFALASQAINEGALIEWAWAGVNKQNFWCNTIGNCSGSWGNSYANQINTDTTPARTYSEDGIWHASAATFAASLSAGDRTYLDGQLTERTPSSAQVYSLPFGRTNATMGYSRFFSPSNKFTGYVGEIVVTSNQITDSSVTSFQGDEDTAWGITTFTGWTPYTATLNQNTTLANTGPLLGVNEEGLEFGTTVVRSAAAAYYALRGMNIARVPFSWPRLQPSVGGSLDSGYLSLLQQEASTFKSNGIDSILDNHSGPAYSGCVINQPTCPTTAQFASFWGLVATAFLSNPDVSFDLANEPAAFGSDYTGWAAVVQAAINAIRGTGATQKIFVEMNNGSASCNGGDGPAGTAFLTLTDSASNLVYECHNYFDSNNGGFLNTAAYANQGQASTDLTSITAWALSNNVRLFFGEFGLSFTPSMYTEMKVAYDIMAANQSNGTSAGWLGSTAWGGGQTPPVGVWGNGYFFVMEPTIFDSNPVTDRPVMRFLNNYWTGHPWKCSNGSTGTCITTNWPYNVQFP